jgi:hypothetical protein
MPLLLNFTQKFRSCLQKREQIRVDLVFSGQLIYLIKPDEVARCGIGSLRRPKHNEKRQNDKLTA